MLKRDPARGIYHKEKLTGLPFQIVITGELEGDEYAAYRALTDRTKEEDVLCVLKIDGRKPMLRCILMLRSILSQRKTRDSWEHMGGKCHVKQRIV